MTVSSGVYVIRNNVDDRIYIGCSVDIRNRWNRHRTGLRTRRHMNEGLQIAWIAYGEAAFRVEIIEVLDWPMPADLAAAERRHLRAADPALLYNKLPRALCRALEVSSLADLIEYVPDAPPVAEELG